jgi:glutathione S-transferase
MITARSVPETPSASLVYVTLRLRCLFAPLYFIVSWLSADMTSLFATSEGGMTLYCKAGPDGPGQIGDCPFCHFVRLVLEEKGLEYELIPATKDSKPKWLVDQYEGKMPALRHRKECYVESDVIVAYLDFFFAKETNEKVSNDAESAAQAILDGFFPTVAKYLKHTPDGDDGDLALRDDLETKLGALNEHLTALDDRSTVTGLSVDQPLSLIDCKLAPQLYHCAVGVEAFKGWRIREKYPAVQDYLRAVMSRPSWKATEYPVSTITWGWGNARQ